MKAQKIKTNIIELDKLQQTPCKEWLKRFKDGKIDAHDTFIRYDQQYPWLYKYSNYDLIGWEIDNEVFDWDGRSWAAAQYCPDNIDPEKYNWKEDSWAIARYCPDKLDPERFNWEKDSREVAKSCPDKLDPERFNWEKDSHYVAKYCPEKLSLMPERYKNKTTMLNNKKGGFMNEEKLQEKSYNEPDSVCQPELSLIIEKLKTIVNNYESIVYDTRYKLQLIKEYEEPLTLNYDYEKQTESATEEINYLLYQLNIFNDIAERNLRHLREII